MSRSRLVANWVTTGLVASSMVSGGVADVLDVQSSVDGFVRLGYPLHFVPSCEQDALEDEPEADRAHPQALRNRAKRRSH